MNKGSKRITVRLGSDLIDMIDDALKTRNEKAVLCDDWNRSDFIVRAIVDKLNHNHRSCGRNLKVVIVKRGENAPTEVEIL